MWLPVTVSSVPDFARPKSRTLTPVRAIIGQTQVRALIDCADQLNPHSARNSVCGRATSPDRPFNQLQVVRSQVFLGGFGVTVVYPLSINLT